MKIHFRIAIGILITLLGLWGTSNQTHRIDMSPSILAGSWSWYWHTDVAVGDLILIKDPTDATLMSIRRIVALPGDSVQFMNDGILINGRRLPQLDMREWDADSRVWQELSTNAHSEVTWEIIQQNRSSPFVTDIVNVPVDHVYVMCDNRSECIDSRWWGPIPNSLIKGTIAISICPFCSDGMNNRKSVLYY